MLRRSREHVVPAILTADLTRAPEPVKPRPMSTALRFFRGRAPIAMFALISTVGLAAWAESKFAVVDLQRAMMETEDGLRMQANLKKLFDSKQQTLESKQAELDRERADIEKQESVISQDALRKRAEAWQREVLALQQMSVTYNQEMQTKQNELTKPIFEKTSQIIRRLATNEGYDLVVDRMAVAYVRSDLDLTDRVITLYNGGVAPAPADSAGAGKPAPKAAPAATTPKAPVGGAPGPKP
jgi:outer membrane protein